MIDLDWIFKIYSYEHWYFVYFNWDQVGFVNCRSHLYKFIRLQHYYDLGWFIVQDCMFSNWFVEIIIKVESINLDTKAAKSFYDGWCDFIVDVNLEEKYKWG